MCYVFLFGQSTQRYMCLWKGELLSYKTERGHRFQAMVFTYVLLYINIVSSRESGYTVDLHIMKQLCRSQPWLFDDYRERILSFRFLGCLHVYAVEWVLSAALLSLSSWSRLLCDFYVYSKQSPRFFSFCPTKAYLKRIRKHSCNTFICFRETMYEVKGAKFFRFYLYIFTFGLFTGFKRSCWSDFLTSTQVKSTDWNKI